MHEGGGSYMPRKQNDASYGYKILDLFITLMISGEKYYLTDLASKYDCSKGTILKLIRDIENVIGNNLVRGKTKNRCWYHINSFNNRQTFALEFEELRFLHLYKDLAKKMLPTKAAERIDSTLMNLSCLLNDKDYVKRHSAQQQQVWFSAKGYIDYSNHQKQISTLLTAIDDQKYCYVTYKPAGKAIKEYFYAPERIIYRNNAYYVLGHKTKKDATQETLPRNFAIHRIKHVLPTNQPITHSFNEEDLGYFGLKWHEPKQFSILFTSDAAPYIKERIWSSEQDIQNNKDGTITLTIASTSELEINSWVRSFGDEAKILSVKNYPLD